MESPRRGGGAFQAVLVGARYGKPRGCSDWSRDTEDRGLGNEESVNGELGRITSPLTEKWSNARGMESSHLLFRKTTLVAFCSLNSRDED